MYGMLSVSYVCAHASMVCIDGDGGEDADHVELAMHV